MGILKFEVMEYEKEAYKSKENKTKPRKSKFIELLKIEQQVKEGTQKIKDAIRKRPHKNPYWRKKHKAKTIDNA